MEEHEVGDCGGWGGGLGAGTCSQRPEGGEGASGSRAQGVASAGAAGRRA